MLIFKQLYLSIIVLIMVVCGYTQAADTTITLKGNVKASPCVVDSAMLTVELGDYFMDSKSTYSDWKNLDLKLSSCPSGTSKVTATFSGTAGTDPTYFYANSGTAKGVNVELGDTSGNGKGNGKVMDVSITSGTAKLSLRARIAVTDKKTLAVGTVNTAVTVTYSYS
ncbi:fimbrial protein [Citrobacter europaeus]|uniref:fimbrial protein n=1 Tax=Citrobacter europaeus TaxID=1914243 RepID=UPI0039C21853